MATSSVLMREIIPEASVGIARVEHFTVSDKDSRWSAIASQGRNYVDAGEYARLYVGDTLMMSDTPMEHRSNCRIMYSSNGHVLIAGLGLGMVLTSVLERDEVLTVTVVEKYQDVIDLIAPRFADPKLSVICADIFQWEPPKSARWDTIYFDIWPNICLDNLDDMAKLHRRFSHRLNRSNPKAWMDSWQRASLLSQRRRERGFRW